MIYTAVSSAMWENNNSVLVLVLPHGKFVYWVREAIQHFTVEQMR